jgi:hypothetical protein
MTHLALSQRAELDVTFDAERCLRQVEIDAQRHVLTALRTTAISTEPPESATEELLENVLDTAELAEKVLAAKGLAAIVFRSFLRIREHLVRLSYITKSRLCLRVPWIGIRVSLSRQLSERLPDLVL